jgi:dolichol-phosphate mannosyltransferase
MLTLVVLPTYQEAENIELFLRRVREVLPAVDVLVVDDSSPDGTGELAEKVGADAGQIDVVHRPLKDGLGNAYRQGFGEGLRRGYDAIVQMDVDFSHDVVVVPQLLERLDDGADVAIGSRYVPGGSTPNWPAFRRALSKWGNRYAGAVLELPVRDATSGFRAYRAEILDAIDVAGTRANGYAFQMEVAFRLASQGARVVEVPITFTDRVRGTSKMSVAIMAESMALVTWWGLRRRARALTARVRARRGA